MLKLATILFSAMSVMCLLNSKDYGAALRELAAPAHEQCKLFTGVTEEQIKEVQKGNFDAPDVIKRYTICLWSIVGIVDINLKPNVTKIKELEPKALKNRAWKIYSVCSDVARKQEGKTILEKIWEAKRCTYNADKKNFVVIGHD